MAQRKTHAFQERLLPKQDRRHRFDFDPETDVYVRDTNDIQEEYSGLYSEELGFEAGQTIHVLSKSNGSVEMFSNCMTAIARECFIEEQTLHLVH